MQKRIESSPTARFVNPQQRGATGLLAVALLLALAASRQLPSAGNASQAKPPVKTFDYTDYAQALKTFVTEDYQVRYADLKDRPDALLRFLDQLAAASPESHPDLFPSEAARLAYWINAYNAFTLKGVIDRYPTKSIITFGTLFGQRFFKSKRYLAGGRRISLDEIEHRILRKRFAEPRIHFAINCASASCPVLERVPYLPETLDSQLEKSARRYLGSPAGLKWEEGALHLSAIFDWFAEDFLAYAERKGSQNLRITDFIVDFASPEDARRIREQDPEVNYLDYDWSLNDAVPVK